MLNINVGSPNPKTTIQYNNKKAQNNINNMVYIHKKSQQFKKCHREITLGEKMVVQDIRVFDGRFNEIR